MDEYVKEKAEKLFDEITEELYEYRVIHDKDPDCIMLSIGDKSVLRKYFQEKYKKFLEQCCSECASKNKLTIFGVNIVSKEDMLEIK